MWDEQITFSYILFTRVIKVSAADVGLGLTLDRHYSNITGRRL